MKLIAALLTTIVLLFGFIAADPEGSDATDDRQPSPKSLRGAVGDFDDRCQSQELDAETNLALERMTMWVQDQFAGDFDRAFAAIHFIEGNGVMNREKCVTHLISIGFDPEFAVNTDPLILDAMDKNGDGKVDALEYGECLRSRLGLCFPVSSDCTGQFGELVTNGQCIALGGKSWRKGDSDSTAVCLPIEGKTKQGSCFMWTIVHNILESVDFPPWMSPVAASVVSSALKLKKLVRM
jgi:hypothetical protein